MKGRSRIEWNLSPIKNTPFFGLGILLVTSGQCRVLDEKNNVFMSETLVLKINR